MGLPAEAPAGEGGEGALAVEAEAPPGDAPAADADAAMRGDLLAHSAGAIVYRVSSENNSGTLAFFLLDGDLTSVWMANRDEPQAQEAVYELAAPARITHVASGVHEGADWSVDQAVEVHVGAAPDGPWVTAGTFRSRPGHLDTLALTDALEGRYVRVVLPARSGPDAPSVLVGEVVIGGTLLEPPPMADFSGAWNGGWLMGTFRLHQDGIRLRGCFADGRPLEGTVDGRVATLRYADSAGHAITGEFVRTSAEEQPIVLQIFHNGDEPPTQALSLTTAVDQVDCTIEGVDSAPPALDPLEASLADTGTALVYDILFDFDRATLRAESGAVLDRIAGILGAHPDWSLTVEGHTDNVGRDAYNQRLSEQRAQAAVQALVARGVNPGRLQAAGFGASRPVADNVTSGGRARNRRVELVRR
jgi:outer membrane protein OmpA-like peptidoglycan-associated protein